MPVPETDYGAFTEKLNKLRAQRINLDSQRVVLTGQIKDVENKLVTKYGESWEDEFNKNIAIVESWESTN